MQEIAMNTYVALSNRFRDVLDADREQGLTTTEIAVLTFVLVAMAVAVGGLLYTYAGDQVGNLPADTTPPTITN